jgi:GTP cyclohydrolase I
LKHHIAYDELHELVRQMAERIKAGFSLGMDMLRLPLVVYPVPRGGIPVALALQRWFVKMEITDDPALAHVVIDDLIDSGATAARFPDKPFFALLDKRPEQTVRNFPNPYHDKWIVFPWEGTAEGGIEDNIVRLIQFIGDDATRGGLLETPARVAKAWQEWCSGYGQDPADVLKCFEDGAEGCDEMVVVRDIPFYSQCEHHLAPFFGSATIGYVPDGKVVGISKLSRVLDIYARRLQVQERLTVQIADALMEHLAAKGAGVVISARHMCMESRGISKQGAVTVSCALRGVFRDQASTRAEFLALARG